jgi:chromosome segregation ATPase
MTRINRFTLASLLISSFSFVSAFSQDCQSQLNRMSELATKCAKELDAYKKENADQDRSIKKMKATITERDKQVDTLSNDLLARKTDISNLNTTVNTLQATLATRRMEIAQRDSTIAARKVEVASLAQTLQERNDTIAALRLALESSRNDLAMKNDIVSMLKTDVEAKRKEISSQSELLASISKEAVQTLRREMDALKKQVAALQNDTPSKPVPQNAQPKAGETKK